MKNKILFITTILIIICSFNLSAQRKALKIDSLLSKYYQYNQFSGVALIEYEGEVIYKKSYGFADRSWNIPNRTNSKFQIASLSKLFTSVLIMQLVEQNKINLDKKVSDYLDYFPYHIGSKISIHDLLSHTSGIPEVTNTIDFEENLRFKDYKLFKKFIRDVQSFDLAFPNGTKSLYSNLNYIILGAIIEEVTQLSFKDAIKEYLLDYIKLENTGCFSNENVLPFYSKGYITSIYGLKNSEFINYNVFHSAFGIYSTIDDIYAFHKALFNNKIVNSKNVYNIIEPSIGGWGYGIKNDTMYLNKGRNEKFRYINSSTFNGFSICYINIPEDNNTIILLDNIEDYSHKNKLENIANNIISILYDKQYDPPKQYLSNLLAQIALTENIDNATQKYYNMKPKELKLYDELKAEHLNGIALSLYYDNKSKEAFKILNLNNVLFPKNYKVLFTLGLVYYYIGDTSNSLKYFNESIKNNANNTPEKMEYYINANNFLKKLMK